VILESAVRTYVDDGYLVVPGLVAQHDIDAICAELVDFAPIGEDPYAWKGYVDPPNRVLLRPHTPRPYNRDDVLSEGFERSAKTRKD
jgi:hypothetical protein